MNGPAIDLHDVAKTYGRRVQALRGIAMRVLPGEIFGLLGPNGAGKTTLVKIMMSVVRPTRAQGTLLGRPLGHKATLARVGYLPEHHRMPSYLTGRQALEFFAALARVDRPTRRHRAAELLELVRMTQWGDHRLRTYSKGMQQRIALAQALMNDPELVVLDEPTDGLDPVGRKETRDMLQQLRAGGKTVFLNSHLLGEVEHLCDRVAILLEGNVVRQGTIAELTAGSEHYLIELAGDDRKTTQAAIRAALPCQLILVAEDPDAPANHREPVESGTLASGESVELCGTTLRIVTGDARRIQPVLDALRGAKVVIQAVRPVRQSLEDYFMQAVSGNAAQFAGQPWSTTVSQTLAIFVGAYRSVNSQKLFWLGLVISGLVAAAFACMGINAQGIKLLFWQLDIPSLSTKNISPAMFYKLMFVNGGIDIWLSWLAAIIALVSTAGIFPRLVSSGMIDLYVSKPIGRLRLFVTEYLAGLLFVTLQVTLFSVASLLVIGLRGGVWEPGLLVAVPVVVCFFSYLFAVCVLLGLLTRSTTAALILTLLFWFMVSTVGQAEQMLLMFQTMEKHEVSFTVETHHPPQRPQAGDPTAVKKGAAPARQASGGHGLENAHRMISIVNSVLPKTRETIALLQRWLIRLADLPSEPGTPQEQAMQAAQREFQEALYRRSPYWILGSSLGFELVVLACAAWVFCRRDY